MKMRLFTSTIAGVVFTTVLVFLASSASAWDRSWHFANPSFNPKSMAGSYLHAVAEATKTAPEGPDIGSILDEAFERAEDLRIEIQEGIGNIDIDLPESRGRTN